MGFETRKLIFRVTMAAVVSVVAIFVIHVAAAYPQEAEIIAQELRQRRLRKRCLK